MAQMATDAMADPFAKVRGRTRFRTPRHVDAVEGGRRSVRCQEADTSSSMVIAAVILLVLNTCLIYFFLRFVPAVSEKS